MIKSIGIVLALCVVMINTDVSANINNDKPEKAAIITCSPASIAGSRALEKKTKKQAADAMRSMLYSPEAKLMAEFTNIVSLIALEQLIVNCAILRELNRGI